MFSWVCPAPEIPRDIAFIPSILKHVKKVYSKREKRLGKLNPNFSSEMKSWAFLLPSVDSGIEKWERETERKPKNERGGRGRGRKERGSSSLSSPPPPRSLTRAIFLAVFDTHSSFLVAKPHGNVWRTFADKNNWKYNTIWSSKVRLSMSKSRHMNLKSQWTQSK